MADVITRLKVESSEYDAKIKRATKSLNEMTTAAEREGNKIATANKENIALAQSLGKMATVSTSARGKMSELSQAIEAATLQYNRLSQAEKQGQFGKALNASITQLQGRLKGLQGEMAAVQGGMGKVGGGGFGASMMQGMGSALSMLGPAALAAGGVTAAIGGLKKVMGDMVSINMQFEQSSANLASVLGKTTDEITPLIDQAKSLGATTRYTAMQILELQANLARLGFNESEILNSTKAIQGMATAMGADLGEAANLAGSALRGFGLNATEMERVASVLSVGTTKSALSFEKLATALPIVQTAAAKTGFTIEDTVAMLGKLTDNGINAASAATQLRKILNDSTTAGTKLANALGGPVKSFDELVVALDKAGKAGQNHADSVTLVNSKNATALDILRDMAAQRTVEIDGVQKQTSALQDLRDSITDCAEGMRDMQRTQDDTLSGSIKMLGSAWEGLMLTFSESNGTIKKVTDSLASLLGAWTKWRQRNNGGDTAIKSYELYSDGLTEDAKRGVNTIVKGYQAGGSTNEQIAQQFTKEKEALEKERDAARALYDELARIEQLKGKRHDMEISSWNEALHNMFGDYNVRTDGAAPDYILRQIAKMNDQIAVKDYGISAVTPVSPDKKTAEDDGEDKSKARLKVLKAQYEEQEKAQIASLDRMAMNEADYEAEVYKIKRETLQKIADLYQEETAEKARANAAISQLDIQYQGTQMRLANKGSKSTKTYETQTGPSGYSQEGISALRKQIQGGMKSMQMGSSEYMVEAARLVDLSTFENLLKASVDRGIQLDPTKLEELFEKIDLGIDIKPEDWGNVVDHINELIEGTEFDQIKLNVNTGNVEKLDKQVGSLEQNLTGAINVFGQLGDAMQQIDDPGAKVAGIIMGAIANIAGTFAASLKGTFTPWDWIAAAISGTATMISTIAAIKSATSGSYASGGIIPGNSFSGDNLTANVNSGELILNRSQQDSIASQLTGNNPMQNLQLSTEISGTNLRVVLNNDNRSKGGSRGYYANIH